jgi:hypothetical protein
MPDFARIFMSFRAFENSCAISGTIFGKHVTENGQLTRWLWVLACDVITDLDGVCNESNRGTAMRALVLLARDTPFESWLLPICSTDKAPD